MPSVIRIASLVSLIMPAPGAVAAQTPAVTAFVNVSVVPMDRERVLPGQTVLVRGDRVVALGPSTKVKVPAGAVRIDGRGKYLIPGLADMHAHVDGDQQLFPLYLANGVTTVRDMYGRPGVMMLRDRVARGELLGPRIYAAGLPNYACPEPLELAACLAAMKAAGIVMAKIYSDSQSRFDSIVALARSLQLPVGGHVSPYVGLERALEVPYATIEHLWGYFDVLVDASPSVSLFFANAGNNDSSFLRALADTARWARPGWRPDPRKVRAIATATRRAGSWNAPTMIVGEQKCWSKENSGSSLDELAPRLRFAIVQSRFLVVKALQDAGAGLLLSTDMGDVTSGFAVHRELELLVLAGLTPYQALATGTRNVAQYLGTEDSTGTVAVGKRADLVLLEGNPLRDIRYTAGPAGVMIGGRWLSHAELDAGLDSFISKYPDEADLFRSLRQQASLHRGIQIYSPPSSPRASPYIAFGDFCERVRTAGR